MFLFSVRFFLPNYWFKTILTCVLKQNLDLSPDSKQGELALLLIRAARALFALTGGDQAWIKHFMRSQNKLTGGVPAIQVQTVQGLMRVVTCLDAIRGKV